MAETIEVDEASLAARIGKVRHVDGYVTETSMLFLIKCPKWEGTIQSEMGKEVRKFFMFNLNQLDQEEVYTQEVLIDIITGTMYDFKTGECLSSTRLKMLRKNKMPEETKKKKVPNEPKKD
jgi:hypothetical protein